MLEDTSDRKIAVIFATDVVGYSKSIEYFNLHDSMENKQDLASLSRGGSGRSRIMEKPIKFWKEMGLK